MKKLIPIATLIIALLFSGLYSCKDDPFEFQLERANALSFRLDTFDLVITNDVVFFEGAQVLHTFNDTLGVLFQRISLQAHGTTPSSVEYWLIVDFDTHTDGNAVGSYTPEYDPENGGISEMRLIVDYSGTLREYKSIPGQNTIYFQVDAQKTDERIMKGVFGGILYLNGDAQSEPSILSDGVFKDITY